MNKQELIKHFEDMPYVSISQMGKKSFIDLIEQLDEPQQLKLKDIISRMKQLDIGTRKVWLDEFLNELGSDYGTMKYKAGYEQGKLEGSMIPYEEPQKVKVSEEEAKFLETFDFNCESDVTTALFHVSRTGWGYYLKDNNGIDLKDLSEGLRELENRKRLIKAILDGYTVEKEKRYRVRIKSTGQYLGKYYINNEILFPRFIYTGRNADEFTRKELEEAGFGWVFSCEGIEVEEIE